MILSPPIVNPFSVSIQSNGKKRLIHDLRHINQYLTTPSFKMEDLNAARPSLFKNGFMFTFDFMKGYYHVNLHPSIQKYFGFSFNFQGEQYFGHYTVGPFGLSSMPLLFTKLLKPWTKRWRSLGLHCFLYLDDGLCICPTREEVEFFSPIVRKDLERAGILEQTQKCVWDPTQAVVWLGFEINLKDYTLSVPNQKIFKALEAIRQACQYNSSPRKLLKAVGILISLAPILGNTAMICTKPLYAEILEKTNPTSKNSPRNKRQKWDKPLSLSQAAKDCLQFWESNLDSIASPLSLEHSPLHSYYE